MDDATLRSLGLAGNDKAIEIIRYREISKKYQNKINKFEKEFPNMRTDKSEMPDIFHYGKLTSYQEMIDHLKAIETHTLLEKLENEINSQKGNLPEICPNCNKKIDWDWKCANFYDEKVTNDATCPECDCVFEEVMQVVSWNKKKN